MQRISFLILRHLREELTDAEQEELQAWVNAAADNRRFFEECTHDGHLLEKLQQYAAFDETAAWEKFAGAHLPEKMRVVKNRNKWWAAAAVLVLLAGAAAYLLRTVPSAPEIAQQPAVVLPGSNKAVLTLADGSAVTLDSAGNQVIMQAGTAIRQQGGLLEYKDGEHAAVGFNTLRTPRGGQFKITLGDGTRVWLNAASSLRYPTAFTENNRTVEVSGEAYFEVAKNAAKPFRVKINEENTITVLGTRFNVNAYTDEASINTTLLEGSVQVAAGAQTRVLQPGQQAQVTAAGITVSQADTEQAVAWKNEIFNFRNADVKAVMRQLSRWYDVEVEYKGAVPGSRFQGEIQRNLPLNDVLDGLQTTGIRFTLEGRKIVIQ
ncbi:iron dicitrate transport regulator FecR [Chitinophaga alhagiae]|uniref:Iron dicitrate transport regulator FecR n=1 Tax=Chitinophaga alhagiae TaxID=2203219 RepID=A0ABM6WE06_9BACT|nr:FecR family protein [Chitinophaga alhagiae]AWO02048.1 iron dicitrate transport regulator FecR [Chitinophaga alhagiae]